MRSNENILEGIEEVKQSDPIPGYRGTISFLESCDSFLELTGFYG